MKVIRDIKDIRFVEKKRYVALGVFDGIHLGHKKLIESAVIKAKEESGLSIVVTFEPHPDRIIYPEKRMLHITTLEEKIEIISKMGVDVLFILKFGPWIRNMQPKIFIYRILNEKLKANELFVGFNYKFGYKSRGDTAFLKKYEETYHYKVNVLSPKIKKGKIVSSTLIKKYIENGQIKDAIMLLGHPFTLSGKVITGKNIGTTIMQIPTANLKVHEDKIIPGNGVYLTEVMIEHEKYHGLMNIGLRPTFNGENRTIEVHIMGFNNNIYQKYISCHLLEKIRDEKHFNHTDDLRRQIKKDIVAARELIEKMS